MPRGKFGLSQSFRGGSQYFFSGRTLVSGNETPEASVTNSPKSEGHSVTLATTGLSSSASAKTTARVRLAVNASVFVSAVGSLKTIVRASANPLKFATTSSRTASHSMDGVNALRLSQSAGKSTGHSVLGNGTQSFATRAGRSISVLRLSAIALRQATSSARQIAYQQISSVSLFQFSTVAELFVKVSDAFRPVFEESLKSEIFTEFPELWTMQENTTATYATENSSISFQDDGVSSYEDGERYPAT